MEARLLESVFPTDTNPQGNLFGGTLVSWMDKAAGRTSMRVRVDVCKESPVDGTSELCTIGHFTMVAMGPDLAPRAHSRRSARRAGPPPAARRLGCVPAGPSVLGLDHSFARNMGKVLNARAAWRRGRY